MNVEATGTLIAAAAAEPTPPRFVQASSIAVYGPRNPHHTSDLLTPQTPVRPFDIYGGHKVEAEELVRGSALDWVILRLGGVISPEFDLGMDPDMVYFEGLLPIDGRLQTVDVRDVAHAFAAATTADAIGQTLLIGGDDSHRLHQGESPRRSPPQWGLWAQQPRAAREIPRMMTAGSPPTGWTRRKPNSCWAFSTIRGRTC